MFFDHLVLGATGEFLNTGDILATLVIFILLMLLLKKFAWGPLMGVMQQREDLIASEIETAENSRQESQKLLEEQRSLLKEARTQAQEIVETAKKQGEVSRQDIIATARTEASRMKDSAVQEIANEREKAVAAVREEVVALSMLAASKVLNKEISEEDNRQLINETIAKAGDIQ
ncbi:F0F1 ATP synthase subunit B [Planomicrobium chinense]|uniref:ATP synthase subunit b n=1 Tax=Planococcus glaciei TaxID=459472 RepID=A0A1G8G6K3_9BACL|nr:MULTISPECIES: F0F1 ATP synthase subunit B [Planococcus]MCP2033675.1 F-type H+-transporting ATPase subunit b [Planomicrobium sp. HSC-17F08]ETP67754.1 F0F1 ATP synthase subunit B [Planococcus glaciei CHR43]KOF09496.1 ATP F0F1 synthase subunit B [Planococcus glaciei]MBX0314190.1 F0F1 ATP synthase subunit B [Planococcus glaciei]MBZ5202108.1 F0F1 ATP synthase subunit B [Planococcus chinensis]